MSVFNERLKELRKASKLTQEEFGEKVGVSKSAVSMWERGKRHPDVPKFEEIADFFNVDMDYLVGKDCAADITEKIRIMGHSVPCSKPKKVLCVDDEIQGLRELCEYLRHNPEVRALTAAIREMTEEEIQELARYGKFLRARDGIK